MSRKTYGCPKRIKFTSATWGTGSSGMVNWWSGVSITTSWLPKPGSWHRLKTVPSPEACNFNPFVSMDTAGYLLTITLTLQSGASASSLSRRANVSCPFSISKPWQKLQGPGLPSRKLLNFLNSEGRFPLLSEMITHLCSSRSLLSSAIAIFVSPNVF